MSERDAFLKAVRENPDDDTVRLVFADWLDDRGDPLGELIRVQIELEPVRDQLDDPRARELSERESILLATHGHEWLGPAADVASEYPAFGPVFRRGLPEMVCLSLDTFLARGADLFSACPTVREVSLYGVAGRGADLAACPHLAKVETLEIADPVYTFFPEESTAVCEALRVARVRCFRIPARCDPPFTHPHLFNAIGLVIAGGWPRWIEFVHLRPFDGVGTEVVALLDRLAGRPVTRLVRPYETLFPLNGDLGHGLRAGHSGDQPVIIADHDPPRHYVVVNPGEPRGGVRSVRSLMYTLPDPAAAATITNHQSEHTFTPGIVRAGEFTTPEGLALRLWPESYVRDYLQDPFTRPPGVSDQWWNSRGGVLRRWLHEGRFVIAWDGREYWADATGRIISA